jgi:simple sugar transport system permease protein
VDDRRVGGESRGVRVKFSAQALIAPVVALLVALSLGDVLILAFGQSPGAVYRLLLEGTWGNAYGRGQVLYKATTLAFTGMSVALGLRAGLFNIGAEGQLAAGAFAAGAVGLALPPGLPWVLAASAAVAAAALAGGLVGAIPGALKARFGAHEVIVTIMLNFVVLALLNWIVAARLHDPETLHTPAVHGGRFRRLADLWPSLHGSAANTTIVLALVAAIALYVALFHTRFGYDVRAVGASPEAAESGGVRVGALFVSTMAISGALAGLAGTNFVLGYKGYYEDGLAGGAGFMGIAVALVGRNHPRGIVPAALLFATLSQGGLAIHAAVPKQLVEVLQATVIIAMVATVPEVRRAIAAAGSRALAKASPARDEAGG